MNDDKFVYKSKERSGNLETMACRVIRIKTETVAFGYKWVLF